MNPLIKFIGALIATKNYRIVRDNGMGFGGMEMFAKHYHGSETKIATGVIETENAVKAENVPVINNVFICFRTCLRNARNKNPKPRIDGHSVTDIGFAVARSLVASVNRLATETDLKLEVLILDDRSDQESIDKLKDIFSKAHFTWALEQTTETGQGPSLLQQFEEARKRDALCYFVEDDWLHEEDGILRMVQFYQHVLNSTGRHLVLTPQEHHSHHINLLPTFLIAHSTGYWRTINHATHCLITHSEIIRDYWDVIENVKYVGTKKRKLGTEIATTNNIFNQYPAFAPTHPAAIHFQYDDILPPLYDWRPLWKQFSD